MSAVPGSHANRAPRIVDGKVVHVIRCSCGQECEGADAARQMLDHLETCPDEADFLQPSSETEAWAAEHYDLETMTLDEWRAQR